MRGERGSVDVLAIEHSAIDGNAGGQGREIVAQRVEIRDVQTCYAAHRGLYHLRVEGVGSACGADDVTDAKPVCRAYDGAQIARVLHAVKRQDEFRCRCVGKTR